VREALLCAPRRLVVGLERLDELEAVGERRRQTRRVVALDREAAAPLRTVRCERGDHDVSSGADRSAGSGDVGVPVGGVDEEVEHGAVVPGVDRVWKAQGAHVGDLVLDTGTVAHLGTELVDRGRRHVDRDHFESVSGEIPDKRRRAGTDDYDSPCARWVASLARSLGSWRRHAAQQCGSRFG
jgi:hypothetical protein